jgi:hypothetical protein
MRMKIGKLFTLIIAASAIAACSTNGSSVNPSVSQAPIAQSKLQFAVGTANIGATGTVGLNTVATFRQDNGLSATLVNTPTITGPAGFVVPVVGSAGNDGGTNHISGTPQSFATSPPSTFGQSGGVFSYGFGPFNSDTLGDAFYPGNPPLYSQPFYVSGTAEAGSGPKLRFVGGPPAYPFFNDGTFPAGFAGYSQGFTMFNATPVAGAYSLSVNVATANAGSPNFTATATLTNLTPLPAIGTPTFTPDGAGGGSGTVNVPADPRIVETMVYVVDIGQAGNNYYSVGPLTGTGVLAYALPDKLGPCTGTGCQSGANATPSITSGDNFLVYAATYDWPMFESSPPANKAATPAITGGSGQADVSTSDFLSGTY